MGKQVEGISRAAPGARRIAAGPIGLATAANRDAAGNQEPRSRPEHARGPLEVVSPRPVLRPREPLGLDRRAAYEQGAVAGGAHGDQTLGGGAHDRFLVEQHRPGQRARMRPAVVGEDPTAGEHAGTQTAPPGGALEQRLQRIRAGHGKPVEQPDPFSARGAGRPHSVAAGARRTRFERDVQRAVSQTGGGGRRRLSYVYDDRLPGRPKLVE